MKDTFVTAINCIDGRVQEPVINYLKKKFQAEYIDMITEPGPEKLLAENTDNAAIKSLKEKLEISINKHHSELIAIIAHHDCAKNPVSKDEQVPQLSKSIELIQSWFPNIKAIKLWIDENWEVNEV